MDLPRDEEMAVAVPEAPEVPRSAPAEVAMETEERYEESRMETQEAGANMSPMSDSGAGRGGAYADGDGRPNEGTEDSGADEDISPAPEEEDGGGNSGPMNED